jgi:hypothetical protein
MPMPQWLRAAQLKAQKSGHHDITSIYGNPKKIQEFKLESYVCQTMTYRKSSDNAFLATSLQIKNCRADELYIYIYLFIYIYHDISVCVMWIYSYEGWWIRNRMLILSMAASCWVSSIETLSSFNKMCGALKCYTPQLSCCLWSIFPILTEGQVGMHQDCFKMFKFLVLVFLVCKIRVPQCPTHNSYDSYGWSPSTNAPGSEAAAASSNLGGRCIKWVSPMCWSTESTNGML